MALSDGAPASIDWLEVRRAYELSGETVGAIIERFGLSPERLRARRVAEGWTTRPQVATPGVLQGHKPVGVDAIALRLNRLLDVGMAMLEKRLTEEGLTKENARALTELCRAEELRMRSTRLKTGKTRETKKHDATYDFRDDPVWLAAELNRRLDQRFGQGDAAGDHRSDDAGREADASCGVAEGVGAA